MSAPRPGALASIFSLEPGTERQERRGRLRERSDMAEKRSADTCEGLPTVDAIADVERAQIDASTIGG